MGIRKNAKYLNNTERENFARACVMLKADIVNPGAPTNEQYSKWDEYVAIHLEIQNAFAPGSSSVNFGHGGDRAYSFLSWHRYFLHRFELDLQSKVSGVMLPYWDWTDTTSIMTDNFLGPNGTISNEVRRGYFARDAPGTGSNPTPAPSWWPSGLVGWRLPSFFGVLSGPLKRRIGNVSGLPSTNDLRQSLAKSTYPEFQNALEGGIGLSSGHQMHNGLHGWVGGTNGQMSYPSVSPFDPLFYLHHCNIDRLWAMWQADGHDMDFPTTGGRPQHNRNDIMYPWMGTTPGYGTNASINSFIPMPDFSALGIQRNVDTLNYRQAYGYTYDTIAVIGIGLDCTGSMLGLTPDPMMSSGPNVTKWEAAKRGVSAFLQDCETVQNSGLIYTIGGIKTFRRLVENDFKSVFPGSGYGLIKSGSTISRSSFDAVIPTITPDGNTPLADALTDIKETLVLPPFEGLPLDEQRYIAMLTDGLSNSGQPLSSIPNGSLAPITIFSMGFGTSLDVDYPTLQGLVDKGKLVSTQQVFHGENAGTIDKFYSNALAAAIGFTSIFDPIIELFEGEYTHFEFDATSADDAFLITAQGMDFNELNWSFHLHAPDGTMVFGDGTNTDHHGMEEMGCNHCCRKPHVTARISNGRLSLLLQRDSANTSCWVGTWRLMVSFKAKVLDAMVMFTPDSLLAPVAAGTLRGPKYERLLINPKDRVAQRNVIHSSANVFDILPPVTNRNEKEACNLTVNIYARTRLQYSLVPDKRNAIVGESVSVVVKDDIIQGNSKINQIFARMISPVSDINLLKFKLNSNNIGHDEVDRRNQEPIVDYAKALAETEKSDHKVVEHNDQSMKVSLHEKGPSHVHIPKVSTAGPYNMSIYIEGEYCPDHDLAPDPGHDNNHNPMNTSDSNSGEDHTDSGQKLSKCDKNCHHESFIRLLTTLVPISESKDSAKDL